MSNKKCGNCGNFEVELLTISDGEMKAPCYLSGVIKISESIGCDRHKSFPILNSVLKKEFMGITKGGLSRKI